MASKMYLSPQSGKGGEKKVQSTLKTLVKAYGDLLLSWRSEKQAILQQCAFLNNLYGTLGSIQRTLLPGSKWKYLFDVHNYPDLQQRLENVLVNDSEHAFQTLRESMRALDNLSLALRMKAEESLQLVSNQSFALFSDSDIFNTTHVLDIVDIANRVWSETDRLKGLVDRLIEAFSPMVTDVKSREVFSKIMDDLSNPLPEASDLAEREWTDLN